MPSRTLYVPIFKMRHLVGRQHRNINRILRETGARIDLDGERREYEGSRMPFQTVVVDCDDPDMLDRAGRAIMASIARETIAPRTVGTPVMQTLPPPPPPTTPPPYAAPGSPRSPPRAPRAPRARRTDPESPPYVFGQGGDEKM